MQIRSHNSSVQKEQNTRQPESGNQQSVPPHLKPCTFVLPHGHWPTVLDCLCDSFPAIHRQHWLSRFERELVLDNHRQPIRHDRPHQTGLRIYYFREIANEKEIPFYESILYMDEHLLVADKPHFLPVTPSGDYVSQTLLSRLIARFQNPELQPLHRIDRHTAGLVLFSVQKKTRGLYQVLFRDQKIDKCYEAIAPALSQLSFPHTRATRIVRGDPFFLSQEVDGEVNAQTIIDVIEQRGDLCRYALQPVSGKKHQLRLHMAALGAPICNDALYPVVNDAIADDYEKPLQLLASEVTFVDPLSGTPRYFKSELRLDW